jgi:hypothetical protein
MSKSLRTHLELVSEREILTVMDKDIPELLDAQSPTLAEDTKAFKENNLLGYYVLINTWLMMIEQWSRYLWKHVKGVCLENGLIFLIRSFSKAADQMVRGEYVEFSLARELIFEVQGNGPIVSVPSDTTKTLHNNSFSSCLLLLRYGKRFSPIGATALSAAAIAGFRETQKRLANLQRVELPWYLIRQVREETLAILNWDRLCADLEKVDIIDSEFTPGVGYDVKADIMSKLKRMTDSWIEYFVQPFGWPLVSLGQGYENPKWGKYNEYDMHVVRVQAVPKNYKTARLIAPEAVHRQALARHMFRIADTYLPKEVQLHDQTQNQKLCALGSKDGLLATLDLSSASDSISVSLLQSILPPRFMRVMDKVLPTHWEDVLISKTVTTRKVKIEDTKIAPKGDQKKQPAKPDPKQGGRKASEKRDDKVASRTDHPRFREEKVVKIDKTIKTRQLQSAATMGNSMTFWLESVVFLAITRAACKWQRIFESVAEGVDDEPTISVYGDDIIVDTQYAPTVIEWLERLGFIVNVDKSFFSPDTRYRESCGEEYLNGTCVTTVYFPRFPIEGKLGSISNKGRRDEFKETYVSSMTSLVDLQHKLFTVCRNASEFISEIVLESEPRMTKSVPADGLGDLWSFESRGKVFNAPATTGKVVYNSSGKPKFDTVAVPGMVREAHLQPITRYTVPSGVKPSDLELRLVFLYNYKLFLEGGPRYASPILRKCGVSEPPLTWEELKGYISLEWVYQK